MYKCVLWGLGTVFVENINMIKFHESQENLKVVAVTSNEKFYNKVLGYRWVSKEDLHTIDYDFIVAMTQRKNYLAVVEEAETLGIIESKIIPYDIFQRTELDITKYLRLKQTPPTIFANNCWGGLTYHSLGLRFTSPFINMYLTASDYLKILKEPEKYMRTSLNLIDKGYNKELSIEYPIVKCEDIVFYFNHYSSFEQAQTSWEKRKQRIKWDDLFIMMYTEEKNLAMDFLNLPYKKKVCFVPFQTEEAELCHIDFAEPLWSSVNKMAKRKILFYDDITLLCEGKIKQLCKYKKV